MERRSSPARGQSWCKSLARRSGVPVLNRRRPFMVNPSSHRGMRPHLGLAAVLALAGVVLAAQPVQIGRAQRLNSSHITISYAVFCLKKKTQNKTSLKFTILQMMSSVRGELVLNDGCVDT